MTHYTLVFAKEGVEPRKVIEFDAVDAASALIYAHRESPDRSAELWGGGRKLCRIRRIPVSEDSMWEILSATA